MALLLHQEETEWMLGPSQPTLSPAYSRSRESIIILIGLETLLTMHYTGLQNRLYNINHPDGDMISY